MLSPLLQSLSVLNPAVIAAGGGGPDGPGGTAALFSGAGSSLRNDFTGFVGFKFTVASSDIYVKSLGRWKVSGNSGTHTVKIADGSTGLDVPGASVTVDLSTGAAGSYVYTELAATIHLSAGNTYYLASQESSGGDQWYDFFSVSPNGGLSVNDAVYYSGGWNIAAAGPNSYVPPNFLYDLTP